MISKMMLIFDTFLQYLHIFYKILCCLTFFRLLRNIQMKQSEKK